MSNKTLDPSTLKRFPEDSIVTKINDQFVEKHVAIHRANLQKAADKLGIPFNEENLPAIARELQAMKTAQNAATSKK